jgi:peptidoglycan/LPS O-acetylase OafA/YrhL
LASEERAEPTRLPVLDAIRVLGICLVISLIHSRGFLQLAVGYSLPDWEPIGGTFALAPVTWVAGYAARLSYSRLQSRGQSVGFAARHFLVKRLVRLYPLYLLMLCVFVVLWYRDTSATWITVQVFGLGTLTSKVIPPVLRTLYYIQLLFVFYLSFVGIMAAKGARSRGSLALLGFVAFTVISVFFGDIRLSIYYPCFIIGALVPLNSVMAPKKLLAIAALVVFAVACAISAVFNMSEDLSSLWRIPAALSSLVLLAAVGGWLARHVRASVLARLSYASFGAYLVHRPMYGALAKVLHPVSMWSAVLVFVVGTTVLAFAIGYVLQWCYDWAIRRCSPRSPTP